MHLHLLSPRMTRRSMDSDWKLRMSPPLALLTLAALTPPEHRVTLNDTLFYRKFGKLTCWAGRLLGMRNCARLARALAYPARTQLNRRGTENVGLSFPSFETAAAGERT
jgi:hypothetical protein